MKWVLLIAPSFFFFERDIDYKTKDVGNVHDLPDMNQCNTGWFIGTLMIDDRGL